jgi:hypothetical protein
VEILHSPIVGPLELNEATINPIVFIEVCLKEFDKFTINLANFNE